MKIETNLDTEKGLFMLPNIATAYRCEDKALVFVFMFACWAFSIEFAFK